MSKLKNSNTFITIIKLLALFKEHIKALVLGLILLVCTTAFTLLPPILIKQAIDKVKTNNSEFLLYTFMLIIGATIVKGFFYYAQRLLMESTGQRIIHNLRAKTLSHINRLSFSFFDKTETGDIVSRATSDIDILSRFYSFGLVNIINNLFTFVGILIVLLYWKAKLSLAFLALLPFVYHAMKKYALGVRPVMGKIRKGFGKLTSTVQQSFSGIETLKTLGIEEHENNKFLKQSNKLLASNIESSKITAIWFPYVHFLMALGTAFTLFWGGYLAINNEITTGMLFGFLTYLGMLLRPIRQTGMLLGMSISSATAGERIFQLLEQDQEDVNKGVWPNQLDGSIEFKDIFFSYDEGNNVLQGLNLKINANETIALVGPSGAGKSTIVSLIPRFYQQNSGELLIDSINTQELNLLKLRQSIGYMHQLPFMFDGTIYDNLVFGKKDATMEEVIEAAKKTKLHDFIMTLPKKYYTEIGEKGVLLSGGQKQRVAMARVLITNPKILILDEPTSNLDKETETEINKSLQQIFKNRTVIIIAHRLWTIEKSDKIAFIKEGKALSFAPHNELLRISPDYKLFINSQLKKEGVE